MTWILKRKRKSGPGCSTSFESQDTNLSIFRISQIVVNRPAMKTESRKKNVTHRKYNVTNGKLLRYELKN